MTWIKTWEGIVEKDWLDTLDHVNFLTYQRVADLGSIELWRQAKEGVASEPNLQLVMVETYVRYLRELRLGAPVEIRSSVIGWDAKRVHLFHRLESFSEIACTVETLNLCFDLANRKVTPFTDDISSYFKSWGSPPDDVFPHFSINRKPPRS